MNKHVRANVSVFPTSCKCFVKMIFISLHENQNTTSSIPYHMENKNAHTKAEGTSNRLASLDILRGFDLFLLVFFQPVLVALGQQLNLPWLNSILYQFDHEGWAGFRFWDLVMPLFLFMAGASMPFSLSKHRNDVSKRPVYRKLLKRFAWLFFFGMLVQGNILSFNPQYIRLYSNTLQAIAIGYVIAAMVQLHLQWKGMIACVFGLLALYSVPMYLCGDFTPEGNFAEHVDRWVLGRWRDGVYWNTDGTWSFSPYYNYTWIWSSLNFGVTVLLGSFSGMLMKNGNTQRRKTAAYLTAIGIGLTLIGCLWHESMPIIKRIWSSSMTVFSGGLCFLLMAAFYYVIDCLGVQKGLNWLRIYGMNSITAYLLGEVVNFRCLAHSVCYGLEKWFGDYYQVWLTFANFLILFFILRWMYQHRIFLKI